MKSIIKYFLLGLLSLFIFSCQNTNTTDQSAIPLTLSQLRITPGYEWFDYEYNSYVPDSNVIIQIVNSIKPNPKNFYIFVNPSCDCAGTQKQFPAVIKILKNSNVSDSMIKIYSMLKPTNPHPYMSLMHLNQLPSVFVCRDTIPTYSVIDTLTYYSSKATNYTIEQVILKSLQ